MKHTMTLWKPTSKYQAKSILGPDIVQPAKLSKGLYAHQRRLACELLYLAFPELKSLEPYIEPDLRKAMRGLTPKQLREELIEPPKIG